VHYYKLLRFLSLNGGKLIMIEFVYNWFINLPFTVQLSVGWLISCILVLGVIIIIYNPLVLIILISIGLSIAATARILIYYLFQDK
jgi:hypothetical protein